MLAIGGIAFLGAVLSTLPAGPVNLLAIYYVLNGKLRLWNYFIAGILLADVAVCLLGMYFLTHQSSEMLAQAKAYEPYLVGALLVFLFFLGLKLCLSTKVAPATEELSGHASASPWKAVVAGFVATALSPGLLFFWMTWWMKWYDDYSSFSSFSTLFITSLAICIGDLLIFASYRWLAHRFGEKILTQTSLKKINRGIGCLLMLAAIALGFSI